MTGILIKVGNLDAAPPGRPLCEDKGRDWSDAYKIKNPRVVRKFFTALSRNQPCCHFDLETLASRTGIIHFCYLTHSVYGPLLWQPFQMYKLRKSQVVRFTLFFLTCTI